MQALNLGTPRGIHLVHNAQPGLTAIRTNLTDLQDACAAFGEESDTRPLILQLAESLRTHAETLSDVTGEDMTVLAANAFVDLRTERLNGIIRQIHRGPFQHIFSTEDGSKLPLRKFRRSFAAVTSAASSYSHRENAAATIARAVDEAKTHLADLYLVDETLDGWYRKQITLGLDSLLTILAEPFIDEVAYEPRNPDQHRMKLLDALDELSLRMSCFIDSAHGGGAEVTIIKGKTLTMRLEISSHLFEPLTDTTPLVASLAAIQADCAALKNLRSKVTHERFSSTHDAQPMVANQIDVVRRLLQPPAKAVSTPQPQPSLMQRALAAAWS